MQAYIFGEGTDFWTIFIKVVVDQFVWNPIYAAPSNSTPDPSSAWADWAGFVLLLFIYSFMIYFIS
jgi:hypothetical protein